MLDTDYRTYAMFPAHAGMNRLDIIRVLDTLDVPRTCGDEPRNAIGWQLGYNMFPAHAGMNRPDAQQRQARPNVPRTCGDEPNWLHARYHQD